MENEVKLPKEVYERLKIKERKEFQKKVKIIFDKKQAAIRFPAVLVEKFGLKEGDCLIITGYTHNENSGITCDLVLKDVKKNDEDIESKRGTNIKSASEPKEERILEVLAEHDYYLTTTQIAKLADVSWNTAYAYLKKFFENGWINMQSRGRWQLWKAVPP